MAFGMVRINFNGVEGHGWFWAPFGLACVLSKIARASCRIFLSSAMASRVSASLIFSPRLGLGSRA